MSEKTFPPSIQRLNKARKEGDVPNSKIVVVGASLVVAALALWLSPFQVKLTQLAKGAHPYSVSDPVDLLKVGWEIALLGIGVPLTAMLIVSVSVSLFQTHGLVFWGALAPKGSQIGPQAWVMRVWQGITDGSLGLFRVGFLLALVLPVWWRGGGATVELLRLAAGYGVSWESLHYLVGLLLWESALRCGIGVCVIGCVSFWLVRFRYLRKHMMSMDELRDENKEQEGDPHVKSHRRHEHESLLMSDLTARMKRAKVVVIERRKEG